MGKLHSYAKKSDLMDIEIHYNDKVYRFNLFEETTINEDDINWDIKKHTPSAAFVGMLHAKCKKQLKSLESQKKAIFHTAYTEAKKEISKGTGKPVSNDYAGAVAENDKDYKQIQKRIRLAEHHLAVLDVCLIALRDKKELMQSLSANIRKEH